MSGLHPSQFKHQPRPPRKRSPEEHALFRRLRGVLVETARFCQRTNGDLALEVQVPVEASLVTTAYRTLLKEARRSGWEVTEESEEGGYAAFTGPVLADRAVMVVLVPGAQE